jgi:hypothetical protein
VVYKRGSRGVCGRHLNLAMSSKVAIDGPFEAVLGKTHRMEFWRGKGKPEGRSSPPGAPSLLGKSFFKIVRASFKLRNQEAELDESDHELVPT